MFSALTIPAKTYSNDFAKYVEFDASGWFAEATTKEILGLAHAYHRPAVLAKLRSGKRDAILARWPDSSWVMSWRIEPKAELRKARIG
jgi:hypothetical protein